MFVRQVHAVAVEQPNNRFACCKSLLRIKVGVVIPCLGCVMYSAPTGYREDSLDAYLAFTVACSSQLGLLEIGVLCSHKCM